MSREPEQQDAVSRLADALRARGPTNSVSSEGDEVLARAVPEVVRVVRALCADAAEEQRQDLVQQTMEIAWRRLVDLVEPDESSFWAWLRQVARNVVANSRRRRRELLTHDGVVEAGEATHDVLVAMQLEERDQVVYEAINAVLDPVEQDVLYHRYVHGLPREEIARLLQLPDTDDVRVILQRAQRRLRIELDRRLAELGRGSSFVRTIEP